jgi:hypothetical protein
MSEGSTSIKDHEDHRAEPEGPVEYGHPPFTLPRRGEWVNLPNSNLAYRKACLNDYQVCLTYPSDK